MAITPMRGAGIGLPLNPGLVTPYTGPVFGNEIQLQGGQTFLIPAGQWVITPGPYTFIQFLDPITGIWRNFPNAGNTPTLVSSDGQNFRLANVTGQQVAAVVTNSGSGYTSTPTVAVSGTGGSTWKAIVGGAISTTLTITTAGAGYNYPPVVILSAPPAGGVQATAIATLSSGVPSFTVIDQGAGYTSAPTVTVIPDPREATAGTPGPTTAVVATTALVASGSAGGAQTVSAVICTNPGTGVLAGTAIPTLTFSGGGGSSAAATIVMCMCATPTNSVVTGTYSGFGTNNFALRTIGGLNASTPTVKNPTLGANVFTPRQAQLFNATNAGAIATAQLTGATVVDGGLFQAIPSTVIDPAIAGTSTFPTFGTSITLGLGASPTDTSLIQPF